ncbi:MAG TPA: hypothetical protein VF521_13090 [Pyrinomonadaceae bacterium]
MLTVIFTTLLMLSSGSVQATSDQTNYIGPPTAEGEMLELDDRREPLDGSGDKVCLACGG